MLDSVQLYQAEKNPAQVFSCKLSEIFKETDFTEHVERMLEWNKPNKILFTKAIHMKTLMMASFLV